MVTSAGGGPEANIGTLVFDVRIDNANLGTAFQGLFNQLRPEIAALGGSEQLGIDPSRTAPDVNQLEQGSESERERARQIVAQRQQLVNIYQYAFATQNFLSSPSTDPTALQRGQQVVPSLIPPSLRNFIGDAAAFTLGPSPAPRSPIPQPPAAPSAINVLAETATDALAAVTTAEQRAADAEQREAEAEALAQDALRSLLNGESSRALQAQGERIRVSRRGSQPSQSQGFEILPSTLGIQGYRAETTAERDARVARQLAAGVENPSRRFGAVFQVLPAPSNAANVFQQLRDADDIAVSVRDPGSFSVEGEEFRFRVGDLPESQGRLAVQVRNVLRAYSDAVLRQGNVPFSANFDIPSEDRRSLGILTEEGFTGFEEEIRTLTNQIYESFLSVFPRAEQYLLAAEGRLDVGPDGQISAAPLYQSRFARQQEAIRSINARQFEVQRLTERQQQQAITAGSFETPPEVLEGLFEDVARGNVQGTFRNLGRTAEQEARARGVTPVRLLTDVPLVAREQIEAYQAYLGTLEELGNVPAGSSAELREIRARLNRQAQQQYRDYLFPPSLPATAEVAEALRPLADRAAATRLRLDAEAYGLTPEELEARRRRREEDEDELGEQPGVPRVIQGSSRVLTEEEQRARRLGGVPSPSDTGAIPLPGRRIPLGSQLGLLPGQGPFIPARTEFEPTVFPDVPRFLDPTPSPALEGQLELRLLRRADLRPYADRGTRPLPVGSATIPPLIASEPDAPEEIQIVDLTEPVDPRFAVRTIRPGSPQDLFAQRALPAAQPATPAPEPEAAPPQQPPPRQPRAPAAAAEPEPEPEQPQQPTAPRRRRGVLTAEDVVAFFDSAVVGRNLSDEQESNALREALLGLDNRRLRALLDFGGVDAIPRDFRGQFNRSEQALVADVIRFTAQARLARDAEPSEPTPARTPAREPDPEPIATPAPEPEPEPLPASARVPRDRPRRPFTDSQVRDLLSNRNDYELLRLSNTQLEGLLDFGDIPIEVSELRQLQGEDLASVFDELRRYSSVSPARVPQRQESVTDAVEDIAEDFAETVFPSTLTTEVPDILRRVLRRQVAGLDARISDGVESVYRDAGDAFAGQPLPVALRDAAAPPAEPPRVPPVAAPGDFDDEERLRSLGLALSQVGDPSALITPGVRPGDPSALISPGGQPGDPSALIAAGFESTSGRFGELFPSDIRRLDQLLLTTAEPPTALQQGVNEFIEEAIRAGIIPDTPALSSADIRHLDLARGPDALLDRAYTDADNEARARAREGIARQERLDAQAAQEAQQLQSGREAQERFARETADRELEATRELREALSERFAPSEPGIPRRPPPDAETELQRFFEEQPSLRNLFPDPVSRGFTAEQRLERVVSFIVAVTSDPDLDLRTITDPFVVARDLGLVDDLPPRTPPPPSAEPEPEVVPPRRVPTPREVLQAIYGDAPEGFTRAFDNFDRPVLIPEGRELPEGFRRTPRTVLERDALATGLFAAGAPDIDPEQREQLERLTAAAFGPTPEGFQRGFDTFGRPAVFPAGAPLPSGLTEFPESFQERILRDAGFFGDGARGGGPFGGGGGGFQPRGNAFAGSSVNIGGIAFSAGLYDLVNNPIIAGGLYAGAATNLTVGQPSIFAAQRNLPVTQAISRFIGLSLEEQQSLLGTVRGGVRAGVDEVRLGASLEFLPSVGELEDLQASVEAIAAVSGESGIEPRTAGRLLRRVDELGIRGGGGRFDFTDTELSLVASLGPSAAEAIASEGVLQQIGRSGLDPTEFLLAAGAVFQGEEDVEALRSFVQRIESDPRARRGGFEGLSLEDVLRRPGFRETPSAFREDPEFFSLIRRILDVLPEIEERRRLVEQPGSFLSREERSDLLDPTRSLGDTLADLEHQFVEFGDSVAGIADALGGVAVGTLRAVNSVPGLGPAVALGVGGVAAGFGALQASGYSPAGVAEVATGVAAGQAAPGLLGRLGGFARPAFGLVGAGIGALGGNALAGLFAGGGFTGLTGGAALGAGVSALPFAGPAVIATALATNEEYRSNVLNPDFGALGRLITTGQLGPDIQTEEDRLRLEFDLLSQEQLDILETFALPTSEDIPGFQPLSEFGSAVVTQTRPRIPDDLDVPPLFSAPETVESFESLTEAQRAALLRLDRTGSFFLPQEESEEEADVSPFIRGTIERVLDADTVDVRLPDDRIERLRLRGVRASELDTPEGRAQARILQATLAEGTAVEFRPTDIERGTGRFEADLRLAEDRQFATINQRIIAQGIADQDSSLPFPGLRGAAEQPVTININIGTLGVTDLEELQDAMRSLGLDLSEISKYTRPSLTVGQTVSPYTGVPNEVIQ